MLLFLDSVPYATADFSARYQVDATNCTWTVEATGGPDSRRCIRRVATSSVGIGHLRVQPVYTQAGVWATQTGCVVGIRTRVENLTRQFTDPDFPFLRANGPSAGGTVALFALNILQDGSLIGLKRDFFGWTTLVTTAPILANATWAFVEWEWERAASGFMSISVNGTQVGTFSGDTIPGRSHTGTWSSVDVMASRSESSPFLDMKGLDLYVCDRSGSVNDARLGPHEVRRLMPASAGADTEWTVTGASENWEAVSEVPPDGDTSYVAATTAGTRDAYTAESVPSGVDAPGVTVSLLAKKTGAGSAELTPSLLGVDGANDIGLEQDTYRYLLQPYDVNPVDNQPFEAADLTDPEVGMVKTT